MFKSVAGIGLGIVVLALVQGAHFRVGSQLDQSARAGVSRSDPAASEADATPLAGENRWSCEERKPDPLALRVDGSGHAWATLATSGGRVRVLVDTGASVTSLSAEDARKLGLAVRDPKRRQARFQTANGVVTAEMDRLVNAKVGHLCVYVLDVAILPPGAMRGSLLGMNFMSKMRKVEYGQGTISLYQ